jgi:hypothetical protein
VRLLALDLLEPLNTSTARIVPCVRESSLRGRQAPLVSFYDYVVAGEYHQQSETRFLCRFVDEENFGLSQYAIALDRLEGTEDTVVSALLDSIADERPAQVMNALWLIGRAQHLPSVAIYRMRELTASANPNTRLWALWALHLIEPSRSVSSQLLLQQIRESECLAHDYLVSEAVILGHLRPRQPPETGRVLVALRSTAHLAIKLSLIKALGEGGESDPQVLDMLLALTIDPECGSAAIRALEAIGPPAGDRAIVLFLDADPRRRLMIVRLLGRLAVASRRAAEFLLLLAGCADRDLSEAAEESLIWSLTR